MWIAKNSITGTTYGKPFKSIYDCSKFINSKLCVLEYEFQRAFALEKEVIDNLKERSLFEIIQDGLREFEEESGIKEAAEIIVENSFSKKAKAQKIIDEELHKLACVRWQRNNIIRCWYVEQERFADGFDF